MRQIPSRCADTYSERPINVRLKKALTREAPPRSILSESMQLGRRLDSPVDNAPHWPEAIFAHFQRVRVRQVGYVPDAGHSRLIQLCKADPDIADVVLTTEEEGVALVAGAALGGQ